MRGLMCAVMCDVILLLLLLPLLLSSLPAGAGGIPSKCQQQMDAWCNTAPSGCVKEEHAAKCFDSNGRIQKFVARRSGPTGGNLWRCYAPSTLSPDRSRFVNGTCFCSLETKLSSMLCRCMTPGNSSCDPPLPPSPPGVITSTVFTPGESGYVAFRIPGIQAVNGSLLVFAEGRKYGCSDFSGQHDVVYKRSTDRAKTWSPLLTLLDPTKLFDSTECPRDSASVTSENKSCQFWDPTPIVDHATGTVFLMTSRSYAHHGWTNVESRMQSQMDMWLLRSTDAGISWSSAPENITEQVWSDTQHLPTPANGHGIQTSTGRLIMPTYVRPAGNCESAVIYSDNHGQTWQFANLSLVGPGTSESEIVQLQHTGAGPGRLMFNHRRSVTRYVSYSGG